MSAEKIAHIAGKTAYRDPRDGWATSRITHDPDEDVKHALGRVQRDAGKLSAMVLELRYASLMRHERPLRRAWDDACRNRCKRDAQTRAAQRIGGAFAIRQYAGSTMVLRELDEYAWLCGIPRERLRDAIDACTRWLDDLREPAERAFQRAMSD